MARFWPLLPALAVVALLTLPVDARAGGGTAADAASALLVGWCAVRLVRLRARPLSRAAAVLLGLPVAGICAAAVTAYDPAVAAPGAVRHLQVFVLVPAAVVTLLRDRRDFAVLAGAVVALALFQGAVGTAQYLTGTGASYMGADVRAVGTFGPGDVMGMATVVAYGLVVCVGLALTTRGRPRMAAYGCAGLLAVPLVLSFSRGAWIATALACAVQLVLTGARRAARLALVAAALGVVLVAGLGVGSAQVEERFASIARVADAPDRSVTDRYTLWAAAGAMWRAEPVTGVGLKGFPAYRDSHASLALSSGSDTAGAGQAFRRQPLESPHNMYLLVLAEQGLLGLITVAAVWPALLVAGVRRLRRRRVAQQAVSPAGLVAVGLLGWQVVDFVYADIGGPTTVLTALVLGLAGWWVLGAGAAAGAEAGVRGDH
ncbi:O-antigen ligase family protein [Streptomyces sp. LP05-1]|uniref:O-antigen ligase family protein n=1 Tax=Streptomyces pyxinae TaxID=2970734 RepID=A0ABT2CNF6_9ACTN|nr:O-antigen ligase family protein [Streptomyces sp. LP05-1]MCS0638981.1 O-antigen ligase family protein [Streptomyces sp. LP05-1]